MGEPKSVYALGGFQDLFLAVVGVASLTLAADGERCTPWIDTIRFLLRKEPRTCIPGDRPSNTGQWCDCFVHKVGQFMRVAGDGLLCVSMGVP